MAHVAGFTVAHDVSARDWQMRRNGKQWLLGKTFDTFCPLGPALVTRDSIAGRLLVFATCTLPCAVPECQEKTMLRQGLGLQVHVELLPEPLRGNTAAAAGKLHPQNELQRALCLVGGFLQLPYLE